MLKTKNVNHKKLLPFQSLWLPLLVASLIGILPGCLTLNVNMTLPEAAVQRATDDYVRELYRAKEKGKSSSPESGPVPAVGTKASLLDFDLIASAHASDSGANVKMGGAAVDKIRERQIARLEDINSLKTAGLIGEGNDGHLVFRSPEKGAPPHTKMDQMKKAQKLIADENTDRDALYAEVLKSNQADKSKLGEVAKSFARSFQVHSPAGTWIQDADGNWVRKP